MEVLILKKMIKEGIIDFDKLLKNTYRDLSITELEAFLLMELNTLKVNGIDFVTPKTLTKKLTITETEAHTLLENLMKKKYLNFELIKKANGKQAESFNIDLAYRRILEHYQNSIMDEIMTTENEYESLEEEVVELLEKNFQKQLKPLEIELITKWIHEYKYTKEDIKDAIFAAIKANRYSISYLDGVLLKKRQINQNIKVRKSPKPKSKALKEFLES
ncbi:MAG: DnaD domain protein [Candidatus Izemoplasmatales bacterium]